MIFIEHLILVGPPGFEPWRGVSRLQRDAFGLSAMSPLLFKADYEVHDHGKRQSTKLRLLLQKQS